MPNTPLAQVKQRFETKEQLVSAVQKLATKELWLDRVNPTKGLAKVANGKLLKLHAALERAAKEFGSRDSLVTAVATLEAHGKDEGYKKRLADYPLPRLLDLHDAAKKRAARAKKSAKAAQPAAPKKRVARSKKAQAKAAAKK